MTVELRLNRRPSNAECTFGELFIEGDFECLTLEDVVREVPGRPVSGWKIKHETAIPAGRYRVVLEDSPKFGPATITLLGVEGFSKIRIHSGSSKKDTDGCVLVGDLVSELNNTIHGGKVRGVLATLKSKVKAALDAGGEVWITVVNS